MSVRAGLAALALSMPAAIAAAQQPQHPQVAPYQGQGQAGGVGATGNGFADFTAENIEALGLVDLDDFAGRTTRAMDCWGYVSPGGREYAIIGLSHGFGFVEVTDPIRPRVVHYENEGNSGWRDVKVYGHHAYGVSESEIGMTIYDLSQIDDGVVARVNTITGHGTDKTHNVVIDTDSGYLYRVGGGAEDSGLRMYDLNADAANPAYLGQAAQGIYIHDAQAVTYATGPLAGRELVFACGGPDTGRTDTRLRIIDVTDKQNVHELASAEYPGRSYAHQGWLSPDRRYFYLNDELDEINRGVTTTTFVFDVQDPASPSFLVAYTNGNTATDHNLYTTDRYVYAANYRSGLRVFDRSADPLDPPEVAWIDTYRLDDRAGTDGAWSNYPYLPSGNILISDMHQGLVVVRLVIDRLDVSIEGGVPERLEPAGQTVSVRVRERGLSLDAARLRLFVETQSQQHELMGTPTGDPQVYRFSVPAMACGQVARLWAVAPTLEGPTFTSPSRAPVEAHRVPVADVLAQPFADDFEGDRGWAFTGDATSGWWERGVPVQNAMAAPALDFDTSGRCLLTWNINEDSDVDGGSVVATSPSIDASFGGTIRYAYWLNDTREFPLSPEDHLSVELSSDGGATWTQVRHYDAASSRWRTDQIDVDDEIGATPTLRFRLIAHDGGVDSTVEAGLDAFEYTGFACTACRADLDGDGDADANDFFLFLDLFAAGDPRADLTGDGRVDVNDFFVYLDLFAIGCG